MYHGIWKCNRLYDSLIRQCKECKVSDEKIRHLPIHSVGHVVTMGKGGGCSGIAVTSRRVGALHRSNANCAPICARINLAALPHCSTCISSINVSHIVRDKACVVASLDLFTGGPIASPDTALSLTELNACSCRPLLEDYLKTQKYTVMSIRINRPSKAHGHGNLRQLESELYEPCIICKGGCVGPNYRGLQENSIRHVETYKFQREHLMSIICKWTKCRGGRYAMKARPSRGQHLRWKKQQKISSCQVKLWPHQSTRNTRNSNEPMKLWLHTL